MLVLRRKRGESIMIGDDVSVTVVSVRALDRSVELPPLEVELGFAAPKDISIRRLELWMRHLEKRGSPVFDKRG